MADAGDGLPLIELYRALPMETRRRVWRRHGERAMLHWLMGAGSLRAAQSPPDGDWGIWVILAGRGFGKTHAGAEWVHARAAGARPRRIALVAPTLDVARAVMVEGESGLLARLPPGEQLTWQPSAKRLLWGNGSEARLYSGAEPNALRGGQFDYAWGDEFAHWPGGEDTVMNLRMATRLGAIPQILLTTTPLPLAWLKTLIAEAGVVVTRGHTADNAANLPRTYLARMEKRFGGTATGRQELAGEIVDDLDWQVRETRFERFVLTLELARVGAAAALMQPSDPGRALVHGDQTAGPTNLLVLDLSPLPGELPDGPRLWIAGAGASAGWRRAGVALSLDDGASYEPVGLLPAPVIMGRTVSVLPAANPAGWDRLGQVEVELLADSMWPACGWKAAANLPCWLAPISRCWGTRSSSLPRPRRWATGAFVCRACCADGAARNWRWAPMRPMNDSCCWIRAPCWPCRCHWKGKAKACCCVPPAPVMRLPCQ
jgi:hypothetical protein